jgi:hypothetical protein
MKRRKGGKKDEIMGNGTLGNSTAIESQSASAKWKSVYRRVLILSSPLFVVLVYLYTTTPKKSNPPVVIPDLSILPPKCFELATSFWHLQTTSTKHPLVLACHRRWCSSWGHCAPCAGIGDRTINLMHLVEHAFQLNQPILLDYPNYNLDIPSSLIYGEGILSELLHTRSYDVTKRTTNSKEWGTSLQFADFFASHQWTSEGYNPCWFPILFQKSKRLASELNKYKETLAYSNSIGIHFRTGDGVAFGISNKDIRVVGDLELALEKMVACASQLEKKLFNTTSTTHIFLATDNREVKELAQRKYPTTVVTTAIRPFSYLKSDDELGVWLDFFLLLSCNGLVVNKRRKGYTGTAHAMSTMATMIKAVGELDQEHILHCDLEAGV